MHNADDFRVTPEDLRFVENTFGCRARIYPYGGHLRNPWFSRNRQDLPALLAPLLETGRQGAMGRFTALAKTAQNLEPQPMP